jgi:DNA-binding transcriptional MerR regulator
MPGNDELTVDELAAKVGMTVRNVRAYAGRGLLPPPRLVGRTGYYGPDHVARLTLVRELLDTGYTLAAVERMLVELPDGPLGLSLFESLVSPWTPTEPERMHELDLARRAGIAHDPATVDALVQLKVVKRVGDEGMLEIPNPDLLRAGLDVISLGVPVEAILELLPKLFAEVEAISKLYVDLFRDTVWRRFADAGMPADGWPEIQRSIDHIIPLAGQALIASFREAMGREIEVAVGEELDVDPTNLRSAG